MRTTLTLDDDIEAKLKAEVRRSGRSFKEVVNDLLRKALTSPTKRARVSFKVHARALGLKSGLNYDHVADLLEQIEGVGHR